MPYLCQTKLVTAYWLKPKAARCLCFLKTNKGVHDYTNECAGLTDVSKYFVTLVQPSPGTYKEIHLLSNLLGVASEYPDIFIYTFLRSWLTLSLPRVIDFNFLFQSLTRDISYSMDNLAIDSLPKWKLIEQSFLTTSLNHFLLEWLGEFALWAWDWKG